MNEEDIEQHQEYYEEEIIQRDDLPETDVEILSRIGDAEVIFVCWMTQVSEEIMEKCLSLKYIWMSCSLFDDY